MFRFLKCCGGYCYFFNCNIKPQTEMPGTYCEGLSLCVGIILFVLVIPELMSLYIFADAFRNSPVERCCGMISEPSDFKAGAVCFEEDFSDIFPKFDKIDINGTVYCQVNNVTCDIFTSSGITTTMEECVYSPEKGYDISDICSAQALIDSDKNTNAQTTTLVFIVGIITASLFVCDTWGCFKGTCCSRPCVQGCHKGAEMGIWGLFIFLGKVFIENAALNGYQNTNTLTRDPTYEYWQDNCAFGTPIWTEYDMADLPAWVQSDEFDAVGWIGLGLSILDFVLWFVIICTCWCTPCRDDKILPKYKPKSTRDNTSTAVQMADPV